MLLPARTLINVCLKGSEVTQLFGFPPARFKPRKFHKQLKSAESERHAPLTHRSHLISCDRSGQRITQPAPHSSTLRLQLHKLQLLRARRYPPVPRSRTHRELRIQKPQDIHIFFKSKGSAQLLLQGDSATLRSVRGSAARPAVTSVLTGSVTSK